MLAICRHKQDYARDGGQTYLQVERLGRDRDEIQHVTLSGGLISRSDFWGRTTSFAHDVDRRRLRVSVSVFSTDARQTCKKIRIRRLYARPRLVHVSALLQ